MMTIEIANEPIGLLPERCAYRLADKTLLAADLHWGKAEVFQHHGIPISSDILRDDLERLSRAIDATGARRLLILGDLTHAVAGLTAEVIDAVARWRLQHAALEIELLRGNHDRFERLPEGWHIEDKRSQVIAPPFIFAHEPESSAEDLHTICGHVHPMAVLHGRGDRLRLPCFVVGKDTTILPAFSSFTGGVNFDPSSTKSRASERIFVIAEDQVIPV